MRKDILDNYEFRKNKGKKSDTHVFKDIVVPILTILISVGIGITTYLINQNTNDNMKDMKEYEVTYMEKRKSFTEMMTSLENMMEKIRKYIWYSEGAGGYTYNDGKKLLEEVNTTLSSIEYQRYNLYPFLNKELRDSLSVKSYQYRRGVWEHSDSSSIVSLGLNEDSFYYNEYVPYRDFIEDKVYNELFKQKEDLVIDKSHKGWKMFKVK